MIRVLSGYDTGRVRGWSLRDCRSSTAREREEKLALRVGRRQRATCCGGPVSRSSLSILQPGPRQISRNALSPLLQLPQVCFRTPLPDCSPCGVLARPCSAAVVRAELVGWGRWKALATLRGHTLNTSWFYKQRHVIQRVGSEYFRLGRDSSSCSTGIQC